jgi:arylsulfatase A
MKLNHLKFLGIILLFVGVACNNSEKNEDTKPNVVLFYLDDSGYGDFAHNGNPTIKTPNITKLKESGVNFTQFYTATAACSAFRPVAKALGALVGTM